ncbi:MAG: MBL fold metallo-hydrolase [Acidobacteriota bacterium]
MKKYICFFAAFMIFFGCGSEKEKSNLIQPDQWYSVHPRPIYSRLEKIGTFQEWFDVYKLTEDTFAIYEPNQFEEAISYLALGKNRAALIDTGTGIGNIKAVTDKLTDLPVVVVLTHEHYDHVAGAYRFDEIIMYNNEKALQVLEKGRGNASLQQYITEDYLWKPLPKDFDPETWVIPSMEPTQLVEDGDLIDLGERTLEVIYTPGHSPGQMCLLDKKTASFLPEIIFSPDPCTLIPRM